MDHQLKTHFRATAHLYLIAATVAVVLYLVVGCASQGTALKAAEEPAKAAVIGYVLGLLSLLVLSNVWGLLIATTSTALTSMFQRKAELAHIAAQQDATPRPDAVPWFLDPWTWVRMALGWALIFFAARYLWQRYAGSFIGKAAGVVQNVTSLGVAPLMRRRRRAPPAVVVSTEQKPHA